MRHVAAMQSPEIVLQSPKAPYDKISAKRQNKRQPPNDVAGVFPDPCRSRSPARAKRVHLGKTASQANFSDSIEAWAARACPLPQVS
jgi:hypothetical protein